jgi:hypothetical protein
MSDWLELVRSANPVPRPQPFDIDARRRITTAIVEHGSIESAPIHTAGPKLAGRGGRRRRGLRGGRPLALVIALCVAGGATAAATGGMFEGPAAVHAPATPTLAAGVAAAGGVLVLATGLSERSKAHPPAFELT